MFLMGEGRTGGRFKLVIQSIELFEINRINNPVRLHGGAISEVRLNGKVASETVISAATAAHFGVPLIMVSGCDAYIEGKRGRTCVSD